MTSENRDQHPPSAQPITRPPGQAPRVAPPLSALLVACILCWGCSGDDDRADAASGEEAGEQTSDSGEGQPDVGEREDEAGSEPLLTGCDPLVPSFCGHPYPSNAYTRRDALTPTGLRLALPVDILPTGSRGHQVQPEVFDLADGFSPGGSLLVHMPGATEAGLPGSTELENSTALDAPTVLLDAVSGVRVPHWVELDRSGQDDGKRSLLIHPAVRLEDATRYIVALRAVQGPEGALEPSAAFLALRDGGEFEDTSSGDPGSIEARRPLYEEIFATLAGAGVARDDLQLAWDFTTASQESTTGWLVEMRDAALARVEEQGFPYTIEGIETDWESDEIAYRVTGTIQVPLFVDDPGPGSMLLFDEAGRPMINPDRENYDVPFELLIPHSASADAPAALMQYGHGLLGSRSQVESGHFRTFMNEYNYAFFGMDLVGMADDDVLHITDILGGGRLDDLQTMFWRMHQGFVNWLVGMRTLSRGITQDETIGALLDGDTRYYHGISQGGIAGGVYMSITTDVERGVLGVMGQPYNLLLNRSTDFDPFFLVLNLALPDAREQQLGLVLIQQLWDRVEPNGYSSYIRAGKLPGTPPHEVLMRVARGDHQVANVAARVMARSVGAVQVQSGFDSVYGLQQVDRAAAGSSYVEYDFGLPGDPMCNVPQRACEDPHGKLRMLQAARLQLDTFLRTGVTENFCEEGRCDFPELSGCAGEPDEPEAACE